MVEVKAVRVNLFGQLMGAVVPLANKPGFFEFQYAPEFVRRGLDVAPLTMPADRRGSARNRFSFPALARETFHGLPGMLADALPDKFGNALIDEYLARKGLAASEVSTLQRLLYVGRRSMGALEFEPAEINLRGDGEALPLEMAHLVEDARRALKGEFSHIAQDIIDIGSSAGGARAKAVIGWHRERRQIVSGQFDLPDGFEHWLLKFDVGTDGVLGTTAGFGRIEYAHYLMALEAGVHMSECCLLEENGRAHFMTRRFDRQGNAKLHQQSLCAMQHLDFNMPYVHGYEQYMRTVLALNLGAPALEQAWLRCAFNMAIVNCDDHTKNLAFLMDRAGHWSLAPAYDTCFAHNPGAGKWTRKHQMQLAGKNWDVSADDLIEFARKYDIPDPKHRLRRIADVVARWPQFASQAGVDKGQVDIIRAFHPGWIEAV